MDRTLMLIVVDKVQRLAFSPDGRWIAAGTWDAVVVWDAATYEKFSLENKGGDVRGVDFSPDSTRLVAANIIKVGSRDSDDGWENTYTGAILVWDVATRNQVLQTVDETDVVLGAKFSPHGDQIATTSPSSLRICNSDDGRLILDIKILDASEVLWQCRDHLFVSSVNTNKIRQIDASTGTISAQWQAHFCPCIATPKYGEFIACLERHFVTIWDTSTRTQLSLMQHSAGLSSIALSPDGRFLAMAEFDGKITIKNLSRFTYQDPLPRLYPPFQAPDIQIDDAALDLWKHDRLVDTEALLTATIATPQNQSHHALASRALVRARLQQWDAAIDDAEKSIKIQFSVIGYIAKSVALVGKGEKHKAYRACDIAFDHHSSRAMFLLIKAVVVFMAGDHDDAIARIDDLIAMLCGNSICFVVQAYMYLLLGKLRMESRQYEGAKRSFERAQAQIRPHTSQGLLVVSLITGWKFDDLGVRIQQQLCEVLYAASRAKKTSVSKVDDLGTTTRRDLCEAIYAASRAQQAREALLKMTHLFNEEVYTSKDLTQWVSDFTQRCLAMPESSESMQRYSSTRKSDRVASSKPSPLLREWARATLMMNGSWTDALTASVGFMAARFTIYRAICERLETNGHMLDASKCFLQMVNELAAETTTHREQAEWVDAFRQRCTVMLEHLGDGAADAQQYDDAITQYSAALSLSVPIPHVFMKRSKLYMSKGLWKDALDDANQAMTLDSSSWSYDRVLLEWTKVNLKSGLWKDALSAARDFKVPRLVIYRILCEGLEKDDEIMDAIDCLHRMTSELMEETMTQGEHADWVLDFRYRCSERLVRFGDAAMDSHRDDEALKYYSTALSIHPTNTLGLFILQSKVCIAKRLWEDAIDRAKHAITLDPSSPWGYEMKRTALHQAGRYDDAIQTYETMLSKMVQSPDLQIRERRDQYVSPSSTRAHIRKVVQRTIRHSPHVLINTTTGRLLNKAEQAAIFMSLPIVSELISSMTTRIDRSRIKREVKQYFRYVMLSHKWEENEPFMITVQIQENVPLTDVLDNVRILDVL
ncbi:hypothetical protein OG21DRAFT_1515960 [Imleria badia]|nr:hypothetical protein OG21DRAFT_1515960 [Imleria badia]